MAHKHRPKKTEGGLWIVKMVKKIEYGAFCGLYGKTLRNRVVEYMLEMPNLDFAVSDITEEIGASKPKMYQIINGLEKEGLIKKSRVVAGAQLYILNKEKKEVRLLQKSFKDCLRNVVNEHQGGIELSPEDVEKLLSIIKQKKNRIFTIDDLKKNLGIRAS